MHLPEDTKMYIILVFLLNCQPGVYSFPIERISLSVRKESVSAKIVVEETTKSYSSTMHQLERCYLWSRTLSHDERLNYLITLRRKICDVRTQRREMYSEYRVPFSRVQRRLTLDHVVHLKYVGMVATPIYIGVLVFFGSFFVWNYYFKTIPNLT